MKTNIKKITIQCNECLGAGFVSSCCGEPMEYDEKKCCNCGKFAHKEYCCEGTYDLKVGDTVEIFISIWSYDYLKEYFNYYPKLNHGLSNSKVFYGKVVEIINERTVKVKIKYSRKKELLLVNIDDIDIVR